MALAHAMRRLDEHALVFDQRAGDLALLVPPPDSQNLSRVDLRVSPEGLVKLGQRSRPRCTP